MPGIPAQNPAAAPAASGARHVSGRAVVLGMLGFGVLATAGIWTYWKLHLAPFLPLQKALVQAYPDSSPRVEGGRHKPLEPALLRLVLKVPFLPRAGDPRVAEMIEQIIFIARQHVDFGKYDELEIYLVQREPEKKPQEYVFKRPIRDLLPPAN